MLQGFIKKFTAVLICLIFLVPNARVAAFIPTNRDTRMPPGAFQFSEIDLYPFTFLGQFGDIRYYFRDDRDILAAICANGSFQWISGLNAPFGADIDNIINAAQTSVSWGSLTEEERRRVAEPREERLNATWTGLANSLLTVEYYDSLLNPQMISSASREGVTSTLAEAGAGHFRLDIDFHRIDLFIPVHIFLSETGITYHISHEEITGSGRYSMGAIVFTPFKGATGGVRSHFNLETNTWEEPQRVPMIPGYAFIPDGSGALVRFQENTASINRFAGEVFGSDAAINPLSYEFGLSAIMGRDRYHPLMPVFGVTHGYNQQAFVAWASQGAEHMEIIMMPHENTTFYNFVYPRFLINRPIHQVYDMRGSGFFRLFNERLQYDITMEYRFLTGEEANYAGMARAYRQNLIERGLLTPRSVEGGQMPVRLDFIMSDVRNSVIGRTNVVTTTAQQVGDFVKEMQDLGISSINGGMFGAQNGGLTTGRPWQLNFNRNIGNRRAFRRLFNDMESIGADISFAQDFSIINTFQMNMPRNQAFHMNRTGVIATKATEFFLPVNLISFARADRSAEWLLQHSRQAINAGAASVTASGMTYRLISHHGRRDAAGTIEAAEQLQESFRNVSVPVNAHTPNQFLWPYVKRFLQTPVFNNQFILFTDTVPFLQMVLHNTMELYAPYSNFSFYTKADMLRMIDYNVFPSFVLTHSPAHYLSNTNSLNFYSTEFEIYREIIAEVYSITAPILSYVKDLEWTNREVLAPGIILNSYEYGAVEVLINYTADVFTHRGETIPALSARLFS